jgi:hypothetical protein
MTLELIQMVTEKNNMHDMDTWMFFRWFFKAAVAVYLLTNTFNIVMAVFDIGQNVVSAAAGVIGGSTRIDITSTLDTIRTGMETMEIGELLGLTIETLLVSLCLKIMSILITVILYGRMIEIYLTVSVAPMYDGEETTVELQCDNSLMKVVIDRFGEDVDTKSMSDGTFLARLTVSASPTFYGWVFQFAGLMKIVSPKAVKEQYEEMLENARK